MYRHLLCRNRIFLGPIGSPEISVPRGDFKGVGHFKAKFRLKGYVWRQYLWTFRWGNGYTRTLRVSQKCGSAEVLKCGSETAEF